MDQHRAALQFPGERFAYIGLPPAGPAFDAAAARKGELKHAVVPFLSDPYGCASPGLTSKRKERNPYLRTAPYTLSAPEIAPLLAWCGPALYSGALPWKSEL